MDLYSLSISSWGMSDDTLLDLLSSVKKNSIVLFEDIDAATRSREQIEELTKKSNGPEQDIPHTGVTLSGLLNAIDGIGATEGYILVMTTNYAEKLDDALIRPGRIDYKIPFTWATSDQIQRMFVRFYPDKAEKAVPFSELLAGHNISMARLQEHCVRWRDCPDKAVENIGELLDAKRISMP